jgi:hypothetical protein
LKKLIILAVFILVVFLGWGISNFVTIHRSSLYMSGSEHNNYIEKKLSKHLFYLSPYLRAGNKCSESFANGSVDLAVDCFYFKPQHKERIVRSVKIFIEQLGDGAEFLPNQWHFVDSSTKGDEYIMLLKIIKGERATASVMLFFKKGIRKPIGMRVIQKNGEYDEGLTGVNISQPTN